ncbi:hypothetical protein CYLTODRAFT_486347 [Cylindrobasidium torrendii FP15055 ss-10]|uniref:DASH complex subunit DAD1 n=1 Tax=Cylindrobasidium torrendii FP15055 ss-10 TaxID=1314674 RepID=A0A0D7BQS0_9AGAR|nr:hypothetical protein CYLTODRAFT_486347 [Cylindrobasidium torrendii FP15055 ss-10]
MPEPSRNETPSFFDLERERLTREITTGFEELLSSNNSLNRVLQDVLGRAEEWDTLATLWTSFADLMKQSHTVVPETEQGMGVPGTGGHIVAGSTSAKP